MTDYDVVIVGASFAGLTLAKHLPQNLKVLVVEAKPTVGARVESTGLITTKTREEFSSFLKIDNYITNKISSICVVAPDYKNIFFSSTNEPWIYQTDTKALVAHMAEILPPNVNIKTSTAFFTAINEDNNLNVTLISNATKNKITTRFLVGADGAKSQVALAFKELSKNHKFLFGYERVYFGDVLLGDNPTETIYHFWFGEFSLGYGGWLSPTMLNGRPAIRLGLAKLMKDRADASKLTDDFVLKLVESKIISLHDKSPNHIFGSLIPIGGVLKNTYHNNVMLLGNSAGFCGAFAADGIKGAIIAGKESAPLIAEYLNGQKSAITKFDAAINKHDWLLDYYGRQVRYRWIWDIMKRDKTFFTLWRVIERSKESFLDQFCDSKDKRRSLVWTVIKMKNIPLLIKFSFYLVIDIISPQRQSKK